MSFTRLILKNLLRQRTRTSLTVLGISIGIMTVVALGVITDGLKSTAGEIIQSGGADFMLGQKGSSDLSFSTVTEDELRLIAARPDVERAVGALFVIKRVGSNPYFPAIGIAPDDLQSAELNVTAGQLLSPRATDEAMLGTRAASDLGIGLGGTITIDDRPFLVVGLYESGNLWEDMGAFVPLATAQELAGREGVVTVIYVTVASGRSPEDVAAAIETDHPDLAAILSQADYGEVDQGMQLIDSANLAISLLAVGIGAIGVMNTMVMAVFERTREIGVLRAVGWRGSRILRMIVIESLLLCAIAAAVGTLLGVLAGQAALAIPSIGGLLEPKYSVDVFLKAIVVAVGVAIVGAIYPSIRAVRLTPMEALRHE